MTGASVVVIDDDESVRSLIALTLANAGFAAHTAANGEEGLALVAAHRPSVVTLDLAMPGMHGFEVTRRIREVSDTHLIVITAHGGESDAVEALQLGADDVIVKPFRPRELRARVAAVVRRRGASSPDRLAAAGLVLVESTHAVTCDGADVEVTPNEFAILRALLRASGAALTKRALAQAFRGPDATHLTAHDDRTVEVHVANLRRKLGESADTATRILTVRGVGYRVAVDAG